MSGETKHVTALDFGAGVPRPRITRGAPIEKLPEYQDAYVPYTALIAKINELIDRINAMNEVPNGR